MTFQFKPIQECSSVAALIACLALPACGGGGDDGGGGAGTRGGTTGSGGTTSSGGTVSTFGGATSGGATSGGATSGGASSGGASSGGASSGGASSGGTASGGSPGAGGATAGSSSGGSTQGGSSSGGAAGMGSAGKAGGSGSSSGGAGGGGSSSGGSTSGGSSSGGASGGSGGKGGASSGGSSSGGSAGSGSGGMTSTCKAPDFAMYGYAKSANVTGGGKGSPTNVSSLSALQSAAGKGGVVQITGKISGSGIVRVASNTTIVGQGSAGELQGIELSLADSSNIIVRNLKIHHVPASTEDGDLIHLQDTKNVWIDHVELWNDSAAVNSDKDKYDGMIDLTHATSNVTVSWSYLHDHWKGMLNGSSDDDASDRKLTFHHNWVKNVNSRLPSYRGGNAHVYNNYYEQVATSGVNTRVNACVRVEKNHFFNVMKPITTLDSDVVGKVDAIDNLLEMSTAATGNEYPPTCTWNGGYTYPTDPTSCVKQIVTANAGVGKIDPLQ